VRGLKGEREMISSRDNKNNQFKCIECSDGVVFIDERKEAACCVTCGQGYPLVEGVVLTIKKSEDFFRYHEKLDRFFRFRGK
jgi:hypothetical protein